MLTILKFYSTTCVPCKLLKPVLEQLQVDLENKFEIIEINVEKDYESTATYNIMSVPTLIVLKDNKEVDRCIGAVSLGRLKEFVQRNL